MAAVRSAVLWARPIAPAHLSWVSFGAADPLKIPIDANGNLSQKTEGTDNWTYSWNAENQLTKVEKNGTEVARFGYDPVGRRVEKVAAGVTTSYTYDRVNILREAQGTTTLRYVHGPGSDEELALDDGAAVSFFHADALGSIVKTTNGAGTVTTTRLYDVWGNFQMGGDQAGYAYTGREWDPGTGLYYYRARYYDPKDARFINEDPIGFGGGENFYTYSDGNPVTYNDPLGLAPCTPDQSARCADGCKARGKAYAGCSSYDCGIVAWTWCSCKSPYGECTPIQHAGYQLAVNSACKSGPTACSASMPCAEPASRMAKNLACAAARGHINNVCYGGGDSGHREAAENARAAAAKCAMYMAQKGCK